MVSNRDCVVTGEQGGHRDDVPPDQEIVTDLSVGDLDLDLDLDLDGDLCSVPPFFKARTLQPHFTHNSQFNTFKLAFHLIISPTINMRPHLPVNKVNCLCAGGWLLLLPPSHTPHIPTHPHLRSTVVALWGSRQSRAVGPTSPCPAMRRVLSLAFFRPSRRLHGEGRERMAAGSEGRYALGELGGG